MFQTFQLNELLRVKYGFMAYVRPQAGVGLVVRISAALYNGEEDYRRFAVAVVDAMKELNAHNHN